MSSVNSYLPIFIHVHYTALPFLQLMTFSSPELTWHFIYCSYLLVVKWYWATLPLLLMIVCTSLHIRPYKFYRSFLAHVYASSEGSKSAKVCHDIVFLCQFSSYSKILFSRSSQEIQSSYFSKRYQNHNLWIVFWQ